MCTWLKTQPMLLRTDYKNQVPFVFPLLTHSVSQTKGEWLHLQFAHRNHIYKGTTVQKELNIHIVNIHVTDVEPGLHRKRTSHSQKTPVLIGEWNKKEKQKGVNQAGTWLFSILYTPESLGGGVSAGAMMG